MTGSDQAHRFGVDEHISTAYKLEQSTLGQKMCFGIISFAERTIDHNILHYFSPKTRISLFSQCKASIGNNSGFYRAAWNADAV